MKEISVVVWEVGRLEESRWLGLGHFGWMARRRGELHPLLHSIVSLTPNLKVFLDQLPLFWFGGLW